MRPLPLFYQRETRLLDPLVQAASLAKAPLLVYGVRGTPSREALLAMEALGLAGAAFEEARPLEGVVPDAEARMAGVMDLAYPVRGVLRGQFAFGVALDRLLSAQAGARALWVGRPHLLLAPFLRALGEVSVLAQSYAEGEAFLARLPAPVRGRVVLKEAEAQALALRADLLVYGGGPLPLSLVQPFHQLLALAEPGERARGLAGRSLGEELPFLWAQAVLEALGY
ncbi:hypothetical protein [Thermus filiformis]|uniref:Uncharacterized protein n=1 Tax=Thermus filiformis TaxID=276 RepID=A0A0A2WVA2_THEFI|nr:hypothetical protein [Thermus filiformis]KGQ22682.1 hypothetical protein THFILI_01240 [Thermus filiformis]